MYKVLVSIFLALILLPIKQGFADIPKAHYANPTFDVVYVRCPRGQTPIMRGTTALANPGGVNDLWLSAANNIVQEPGCDLVLHHADSNYMGQGKTPLPVADRDREEVLVNCDETDKTKPVCTIADPNVSFDGNTIIYTKFTDTRTFIAGRILNGDGGWSYQDHSQAQDVIYPNGDGACGGKYVCQVQGGVLPYNAPALIFKYDLTTHTESQVSPDTNFMAGRAIPNKSTEFHDNYPVMDTGPVFINNNRIAFTSNRESGYGRFAIFEMNLDGSDMAWIGHRTVCMQLHPWVLMDGRIGYTSCEKILDRSTNNDYALFSINPDGSNPFIIAGKHDASALTYHYATQLSNGDIVTTLYYDHNNIGNGILLRFPIDPPGADFIHLQGDIRNTSPFMSDTWKFGNSYIPFGKPGQFVVTPEGTAGDSGGPIYSTSQQWQMPDGTLIIRGIRFTHPAAAPNNGLLMTVCKGECSTMPDTGWNLPNYADYIGKDAGIWLCPDNNGQPIASVENTCGIVVDFPEYHEIMARAVVPYKTIYGIDHPTYIPTTPNDGTDSRIATGEAAGLVGASSLYDRETTALNGTPYNMLDVGGVMSGRTYTNLATSGADLAIYDNSEIYGIRVIGVQVPNPIGYSGGQEQWAGVQQHHLRIIGEFPVRKFNKDGTPMLDAEGHPDTSFVTKIPANTPFLLQAIDKNGMALNIETTSRTVNGGELQVCQGCHYHTKIGQDFSTSYAGMHPETTVDLTGPAKLFNGLDSNGQPTVALASDIYQDLPAIKSRKSFEPDWKNDIAPVIQNRCASCHGKGQTAQIQTGLLLDNTDASYAMLVKNTNGGEKIYSCCMSSRWISILSARSSPLVWMLYGYRMDGRDPSTGLPPAGSGILVDSLGREHPDVWPTDDLKSHAALLSAMPDSEKRLISRWIELGAPKLNAGDDTQRPVITVTYTSGSDSTTTQPPPVTTCTPDKKQHIIDLGRNSTDSDTTVINVNGEAITTQNGRYEITGVSDSIVPGQCTTITPAPIITTSTNPILNVGFADDSAIDWSKINVTLDNQVIWSGDGSQNPVKIPLPSNFSDSSIISITAWDKPDRSISYLNPTVAAANRLIVNVSGMELKRESIH